MNIVFEVLGKLFRRRQNETPVVTTASAEELWALKCEQQKRDHEGILNGSAKPEDMLLLKPEQIKNAKVVWPKSEIHEEE